MSITNVPTEVIYITVIHSDYLVFEGSMLSH